MYTRYLKMQLVSSLLGKDVCVCVCVCFGYEHKDCLFCELDLENNKIFLSYSLDVDHAKS